MDQNNINEAMKLIAYFSLCTTIGLGIGVYIFGHKIKMQREYFERSQKDHARYYAKEFEETFKALAVELGISNLDMFQLIRVAVSGQLVTPPLFESIQILGEGETKSRVKEAGKFLSA